MTPFPYKPELNRLDGAIAGSPNAAAHPAEAAGAGAAAAPASDVGHATSLAALLASHILRDGEIVLLVLKPSLWFIILNSVVFSGVVLVVSLVAAVISHRGHDRLYLDAAAFFIAGRLVWAMLQWMGRLYVLTDQRILRLGGVYVVEVFDCPLRKVVRTRQVSILLEKMVLTGSIEIIPRDESMPTAIWQTISKPREIHKRIIAAINRARQSGTGAE
jgi:hypothetical protein